MTSEAIRANYVALVAGDVRQRPECFKAFVVEDPEGHARQMIDGLSDSDVKRLTRQHRAELRALCKSGASVSAEPNRTRQIRSAL